MFANYSNIFYNYVNKTPEKEKNIILEPLSCIFRMILLNYKEKGTKISIHNNSIYYNDETFYQGVVRSYNGDKRDDLHNLYNPFLKVFEWYPIENDEKMKYFYGKCHNGLEKLSKCYEKGSIIHHTLTHYCSLFKNALDDTTKENIKEPSDKESPLLEDLKLLWKKEEIRIIYQTLKYLDISTDSDEIEVYLNNIDNIVTMKEKKIYEYIQKYSSSYN